MNWRIVYNEQTLRYRIERRRWWGWDFVADEAVGSYLSFSDLAAAKRWGCRHLGQQSQRPRRWQVVDYCRCPFSTDPGP